MYRSSHAGPSWLVVTAVVALTGVALGACSDDPTSTDAAVGETSPASTSGSAQPESAATGEPIRIGFVNNEGGAAFSAPELGVGSQVAVDYVNSSLGGVNGRPIEVVRCVSDGSPEMSIDCANQFVEADVVAVQEGVDLGGDAMLPILADAGIPMVGHVQFGAARMLDANSYYFGTAAIAIGTAAFQYYKSEGITSIEWFFPDAPSSRSYTDDVLMPAAAQLGLSYKTVYYDPTNPNWPVLATTAVADGPDATGALAATDDQCADLVSALRDAGYEGRILASSCGSLSEAIGDDAVGVEIDYDHWPLGALSDAPATEQADLELYADVMEAAGHDDLVGSNALMTFADTLTLQAVLETINGTVAGPSVAAALQATRGLDSFTGPTITCDRTVMPGNTACFAGLLFFEYQPDGSLQPTTDDYVSGVIG